MDAENSRSDSETAELVQVGKLGVGDVPLAAPLTIRRAADLPRPPEAPCEAEESPCACLLAGWLLESPWSWSLPAQSAMEACWLAARLLRPAPREAQAVGEARKAVRTALLLAVKAPGCEALEAAVALCELAGFLDSELCSAKATLAQRETTLAQRRGRGRARLGRR